MYEIAGTRERSAAASATVGRPAVIRVDGSSVYLGERQLFTGTAPELLDRIDQLRARRRPSLVVTANVDQVLDLERRPETAAAYAAADLVLVDGMPLVHLARMLGAQSAHRHTGADLLPQTVAESGHRGWRIVILGGDPQVADGAVHVLRRQHPDADVLTVDFPRISGPDDEAALPVVGELRAIRPDVVFVCLGAPKQEAWYLAWQATLPPAVYIGAGAAVDFAAGRFTRAPALAQRIGAEWVWRLCQEPRRLAGRYLGKGPRFVTVALRSLRAAASRGAR